MKAYVLQVVVIDFDELGGAEIGSVLEHTNYPNDCIMPDAVSFEEHEIGEWADDHPLNYRSTDKLAWLKAREQQNRSSSEAE